MICRRTQTSVGKTQLDELGRMSTKSPLLVNLWDFGADSQAARLRRPRWIPALRGQWIFPWRFAIIRTFPHTAPDIS